jgi:predicted transcriptional regulator
VTLKQLGEQSGVHWVSIAKLESGIGDPQLSTLLKLCKALRITLAQLVHQSQPKGGRHGRQSQKTKG